MGFSFGEEAEPSQVHLCWCSRQKDRGSLGFARAPRPAAAWAGMHETPQPGGAIGD